MEEEKAAAYYDELSRKGEGAARFKQGLGFSSASASDEPFASKPKRPSSLFSAFVRASSPSATSLDEPRRKQAQLEVIQKKLRKEQIRRSSSPSHDRHRRRHSRSPSADRRPHRHSLSRSPDRNRRRRSSRDREDHRSDERRRRSRSRERRRESDCPRRSRDREEDYSHSRSRRSPSRDSRAGDRERRGRREEETGGGKHRSSKKENGGSGVDYSQLIKGYSQMTPAERVKAKMKLQLSETVAKDTDKGSGWERFDFNKDAPLEEDDNEIEVADDDASLVKDIGKSFRFSAVETKREEEIKTAHDNAMFGAPATLIQETKSADDNIRSSAPETDIDIDDGTVLLSDKVIAMQQSSWRDRARRFRNDSET
ncbi:probable ATP-dependent RNA helicase DDX46 [Zingiber officinale]|uniref:Uncharacterized protein n=1 Tax=Zingiber officinale TaxID=94328 RepID=A0A8J5L9B9_ZINOF|nr:probable ATP-dependent RNA helicase DDX46 [Zingiber officinale]KAG6509636.1 hypothetical protein ZIOFF_027636 [Zingiber officinale]